MRKLLPILVVGILVISGLGALATNTNKTSELKTQTFTEMTINEKISTDITTFKIKENNNNYIEVNIGKEEIYLMNPGQPMIPRVLKTYELPFGASNIKVEAIPSNIKEIELSKEIKPASTPMPLTQRPDSIINAQKDQTVYI